MQISDAWRDGSRADDTSVAPLLASLRHTLDSFVRSAWDICPGTAGTLSGGEAQRTKMIRHLGSSLTDVTVHVFDEPTIGLHPHDIARMKRCCCSCATKGNTVLVVEHKPEVIAIADPWSIRDRMPVKAPAEGGLRGTVEGPATDKLPPVDPLTTAQHQATFRAAVGQLEVRGRARTICKTWTLTSLAYWWC